MYTLENFAFLNDFKTSNDNKSFFILKIFFICVTTQIISPRDGKTFIPPRDGKKVSPLVTGKFLDEVKRSAPASDSAGRRRVWGVGVARYCGI